MPGSASALTLLRSLDLLIDGPVRWADQVPERAPGVYVIETVAPAPQAPIDGNALRDWLRRAPGLRVDRAAPTPTALGTRLASFWLPDAAVLYVGAAPRSIAGRVAAQLATPLGQRRPFSGGHWLRALRGAADWRIWWAGTDAVEEYADALLDAFSKSVPEDARSSLPDGAPVLPFGNLETFTGARRSHGITDALVDEPASAPSRAAAPKAAARSRGSSVPRPRTAAPARARAGSPRTATGPPRPEPVHLSAEGLARLNAELHELRTMRRPEVIGRVAAARALGDLRENADYEAARNEQSFLEGRIRSLEQLLTSVVLIEASGAPEVRLGSTVLVETDGAEQTYKLVGSTEADPGKGRISDRSPVGQALLGGRAGDEVVVRLPAGEVRYRIVSVS